MPILEYWERQLIAEAMLTCACGDLANGCPTCRGWADVLSAVDEGDVSAPASVPRAILQGTHERRTVRPAQTDEGTEPQ